MLSRNCKSTEYGICCLPLNSCEQCKAAPKFSEWYCDSSEKSVAYEELKPHQRSELDRLIELYIGTLLLNQVVKDRNTETPKFKDGAHEALNNSKLMAKWQRKKHTHSKIKLKVKIK